MTSRTRGHQLLVEKILMSLANIPDLPPVGTFVTARTAHVESIQSIWKRYPELFGDCTELDIFTIRHLLREAWKSYDPRQKEWIAFVLRNFHAQVTRSRQAFEKDGGKKAVQEFHTVRATQDDWLTLEKLDQSSLAKRLYHVGDSKLAREAREEATLPAFTKFEETFFHLQRNLHRALICQNPECPAPYFFRSKIGQKFCSEECSLNALLASKRKWWTENRGKPKKKRRKR